MHRLFINLDGAGERRTLVEANFAASPQGEWTLESVSRRATSVRVR